MKRFFFCLIAALALVGCEGEEPIINLSTSVVELTADSSTQAISFTASEAWTAQVVISRSNDWCRISPTSGAAGNAHITITTTANDTPDERSVSIVIKSGTIEKIINVTQKQNDAIVLAKSEYEFGVEGGELDFEIQTNVDVTVKTSATWIKQVTTRALESKKLFFDIAASDAQEERVGTITLSGGAATQTITVKQSGISTQPNNEIWYTSTDGNIVTPYATDCFGATIVSNTYENGKGIIKFDGDVTSIGEDAFWDCDRLTEITIPNSVTSIGCQAFGSCSNLTKFYGKFASEDGRCLIVDGVLNSFAHAGLTEYTIPNGVISIGIRAFAYCIDLTSITIPNSVTSIGDEAFCGCENLNKITIPNGVISIGDDAFVYCIDLTSITIPNSVTSIGHGAFSLCGSLAEIKGKFASEDGRCLIVDGVLNSFAPAGLTEYTIPNGVTGIGEDAFAYCRDLTSITIPNGVISIGYYAFGGCDRLTEITIPNSVTSIGKYAFVDCSDLTSITIPNSVTSIGRFAFYDCTSLQNIICEPTTPPTGDIRMFDHIHSSAKIYVPAGSGTAYKIAKYWRDYADMIVEMDTETPPYYPDPSPEDPKTPLDNEIWYTSSDGKTVTPNKADAFGANITSNTYENGKGIIKFDGDVTSIGKEAFNDCSRLTSINIPNSVINIGDGAFWYCNSLTSITIPNSVTSIGLGAFGYCSSLISVTIPNSVTSIEYGAFQACSSLTNITIPNSVTSIEVQVFAYCSSLTSITIPNSVTSIEYGAFVYCSSLRSITIPNSVINIGAGIFAGCSSLQKFYGKFAEDNGRCLIMNDVLIAYAEGSGTEYTIPNSVTSIGYGAFWYCNSLTSITIPDNVTSIGEAAFYKCNNLQNITCERTTPPTGGSDMFDDIHSSAKIYVPAGSGSAYKTAQYWRDYADMIVEMGIPNNEIWYISEDGKVLTPNKTDVFGAYIVSNTYENGKGIIKFDGAVTSIGDHAFFGCENLNKITIPNSVTTIGVCAFDSCWCLTSFTIPNGVTSIGACAFTECCLTEITIPNSVTSIGHDAFRDCLSLQNIICSSTIPPKGGGDMFYTFTLIPKNIYVPLGSGVAYKAAQYWSDYASWIIEKDM